MAADADPRRVGDVLVGGESVAGLDPEQATETARLLGAGARDENRTRSGDGWVGLEDFEGVPVWRRPSVWWLIVPYSLFTLTFGGSLVPKLNLIVDLVCKRYFADRSANDPTFILEPVLPGGDNPQCLIPDIQRSVATFTSLLGVVVGMLSALTAPKLGALSDRYGRTRMVVVCSLGGIVSETILILAARYPDVIHYRWLILGSVVDGLAGSFTAGSVLIHSYASDCTPPSKRGLAIGYLHSCLFSGLAFGPLLAGYFVEHTGSLLSIFYVTLGCHIFFVFFIAFLTPESLSKKRQRAARAKHALEKKKAYEAARAWAESVGTLAPFGRHFATVVRSIRTSNPLAPLNILFPTGPGSTQLRRNLITLALIDMATMGAALGTGTAIILYIESTFGWGNLKSSQFISVVSMFRVFVLLVVLRVLNYFFRTRPAERRRRESSGPIVEKNVGADELDIWLLRGALFFDVVGVTGYIFVRSGTLFFVCAMVAAIGSLGSATIQASLSKHLPSERVGQLLGAVGLLHALARIIAPILFNGLYAATVESYKQAFFVALATVFAVALAASFLVKPHVYMESDDEPNHSENDSEVERQRDAV